MDIKIIPRKLNGTINAMPSKSHAHRVLIARSLARLYGSAAEKAVDIPSFSSDITATKNCIYSLFSSKITTPVLNCQESGSTLRFLLPVAAAVRSKVIFTGSGKLPQRPLSPLMEAMEAHGCSFKEKSADEALPHTPEKICEIHGNLSPGVYHLAGNVSSQFITGLLFALPLLDRDSSLSLTTKLESSGYVDLTLKVLKDFGIVIKTSVSKDGLISYEIPGRQKYHEPENIMIEGDWSNAACWLVCGALGGSITCRGLDFSSTQMDKNIVDILKKMGAEINVEKNSVSVKPKYIHDLYEKNQLSHEVLNALDVSARQIPDLVPVLSSAMAAARGISHITDAGRLKIKESDRLNSICETLNKIGADINICESGLVIKGRTSLKGGTVSSHNDHRIVMAAAAASCICDSPVTITDAEAINKSYPGFFEDFKSLGGKLEKI